MLKWGTSRLFNVDVPSVSSGKWDFLSIRKVWKHELQTQGASVLCLAKDILKTHTPLRPTDTPPPLLLLVLQSSGRFLTSAEHKSLYDKISTLFLSHFRVLIPYRLPLKIPLLHPPLKKLLHLEICQTIDEVQHWPLCLRSYIKSRVQLISQKMPTVRSVLQSAALSDLPSRVLDRATPQDCPCKRWVGLPGVGTLHGHVFFRSTEVLASILCNWTVFQQNLKNASVPALKSFKESLLSSLQDLSGSLPDCRRRTTESIAQRIAGLCETNYKMYAASFPKNVYAPYLSKQARGLPPGIVMSVFDNGPMVANFACHLAWHHIMHAILRDSPRFNELITFAHPTDAKCWLLWQLSDSLALTLTGAYCGFSIFMNCTPLAPLDAAKAFKAYRSYPPSPALRRLAQPLFDSACKKLKTAGPSVDMLKGPGTPATHTLLGPWDLGSMASAMEFFPPEPTEPQQSTAHIRPEIRGHGRVRPAQAPSRRPPPTRRITSSRRWRTIFTDHNLSQRDLHTALLPAAPDLPAMSPVNPRHPIPP